MWLPSEFWLGIIIGVVIGYTLNEVLGFIAFLLTRKKDEEFQD